MVILICIKEGWITVEVLKKSQFISCKNHVKPAEPVILPL